MKPNHGNLKKGMFAVKKILKGTEEDVLPKVLDIIRAWQDDIFQLYINEYIYFDFFSIYPFL